MLPKHDLYTKVNPFDLMCHVTKDRKLDSRYPVSNRITYEVLRSYDTTLHSAYSYVRRILLRRQLQLTSVT